MNTAQPKQHVAGTHRACPPEQTWARIAPQLVAVGVTRVADITGLDRIGIPVFCAIRPRGEILQTSNGKGLRPIDARVSAAMEAIEQWHCEQPPRDAPFAAQHELATDRAAVAPDTLPLFLGDVLQGAERRLQWIAGEDLRDASPVWLPAAAIHANASPRCYTFSTNGLASGNTLTEATLHALYEVIERDVVTRHIAGGIRLRPPAAERVRAESIESPAVASLLERIERAGLRACLVMLRHELPVFWAALLDPDPFHPCTRVNFGYGVHLCPEVAATRALTEAAQARLSFIHGVREDLGHRIRMARDELVRPVFDYFDGLPETLRWGDIEDRSGETLDEDLRHVLELSGSAPVYRADLTKRDVGIPVVRVSIPGTTIDRRFF